MEEKEIKGVVKTDEQLLQEHAEERTKCTVYTRVMGYHRPVETFNAGKQGEFEEREHFVEPCGCCSQDAILK
ncbi:MAG: anaerobic ribonucleoside-triphosphate reductase [Akkermansia sp.]|nr:anaerobic ribonucleoside-triphosphate reductase [Akkermansia sp.]